MSQASQVFANSSAANDATEARRPHAGAAHAQTVSQQANGYSGRQTRDAESIVGELVAQYFRTSTSISGIFPCW